MDFSKSRLWILIAAGTIVWSLTMVKSGWPYGYGIGFWGPNGHDGVWHLALIESLSQGRWDMPIFAGEAIRNYHVGFDVLLALVHRATSLPAPLLYFQLTPPLLALLIGWLSYKFVVMWTKSDAAAFWAAFWVYFGGSLGWILGRGESVFWSAQAISTLVNPPFALSLVVLLVGLVALERRQWWLATITFIVLPHIKIYAGVLAFVALLAAGWKEKRMLVVLAISLVAYLVTNYQLLTTSSQLVVWQPGWFLESMMSLSDRVGWTRFYSAMVNYRLGGEWLKAATAYLVAFAIFWIGNMGTRLVKEFLVLRWISRWKSLEWKEVFLATVIVGGGIVPMLFLQKGTPWNTIQFFYYSLFLSSLLAGVAMAKVKSRLVVVAVVLFTLPTTIQTLKHYLPARPPAMLSRAEIQALQFLSRQPVGVVLTYPFDASAAKEAESHPPRPLYLYESTAYVAAWSGQPSYMEDEVNLNITGFDWPARRQAAQSFFTTLDPILAQKFLSDNAISYVYLADVSRFRPQLGEAQLGVETVYGDGQVAIWKVRP